MRGGHCNGKIAVYAFGRASLGQTDGEDSIETALMKASPGAVGFQTECMFDLLVSGILLRFTNRHRIVTYSLLLQLTPRGSGVVISLKLESPGVTPSPVVLPPPIGSHTPSYRLRQLSSALTRSLQARNAFPCRNPPHFFIILHHYVSRIFPWYIKDWRPCRSTCTGISDSIWYS